MKQWLLPAALSFSALFFSCGTPKADCDSQNCSGCCDASGTCQPGNSNFSCGSSAALCTQCAAGTFCGGGQCLPSNNPGGGSGSTGGGSGSTGGGTATTGGGVGTTGGGSATGGGVGTTGGGTATSGGGIGTSGGGIGTSGGGVGTSGGGVGTSGGGVGTSGGGVGTSGGGVGTTGGGTATTGGGSGTGGGTALPSFTSQLWYYGTISSTTRREVGRVLFPSKTLFPLNIPGSDLRAFHVNPAGRMVAVAADVLVPGRFDLVTVNHDGTNVRTLYQPPAGSNVTYARFSPNGQRLSFEVRDASNNAQLFVMPVSGGSHLNVTPPKATPGDPTLSIINSTWSRDSRYLAIVAEATYDRLNELFLVDMNATTPTPVPLLTAATMGLPGTGTSFWGVTSPVQWAATARNEMLFKYRTSSDVAFRLMRLSTTGTGLAPVPGTPDGVNMTGYAGSFGVGDDGVTVMFSADTVLIQAYDVYRTTLGTSTSTRLTSGVTAPTRPDFNRALESNSTSTSFAFCANWISGGTIYEPWIVSSAGPTRLAAFANSGSFVDDFMWSPDGTQLAMVSDFRVDERFEVALLPSLMQASTPEVLVAPVAGGRVSDSTWTP